MFKKFPKFSHHPAMTLLLCFSLLQELLNQLPNLLHHNVQIISWSLNQDMEPPHLSTPESGSACS